MTTIPFTKGEGTGNDFVIVADPDNSLALSEHDIARLCDRHFGVGADGLLRVVKAAADPELSRLVADDDVHWFMDYRNADGSRAEMCGNGIRVYAKYLQAHGLAEFVRGSSEPIGTRAGTKSVKASHLGFDVDMGRWRLDSTPVAVTPYGSDQAYPGIHINVGNPHIVVELETKEQLAALDLTRAPRLDPEPEAGANVEFVVRGTPFVIDGVGHINMRVYERGVGETLSCGTGTVAASLATRYRSGEQGANGWRVTIPGGAVAVRMFPAEDGEHTSLSGPAELLFSGEFEL